MKRTIITILAILLLFSSGVSPAWAATDSLSYEKFERQLDDAISEPTPTPDLSALYDNMKKGAPGSNISYWDSYQPSVAPKESFWDSYQPSTAQKDSYWDGYQSSTDSASKGSYWDTYQTPAPTRKFTKFITTNTGYVAIRSNGTVYVDADDVWGARTWTDIVDIKWSWKGTMGLKSDGTVVYEGASDAMMDAVKSWKNVVAIECRSDYLYGLRSDGTVYSVSEDGEIHPTVSKWKNVRYITSSLCSAGEAVIGIGKNNSVLHPSNYLEKDQWNGENKNIVAIDSSGWLNLALKADGTVICSGEDRHLVEEQISTWRNIKQVCAGDSMALGLTRDGKVLVAGKLSWLKDIAKWENITKLYVAKDNKLVAGIKNDGSLIVANSPADDAADGKYEIYRRYSDNKVVEVGAITNYGEVHKLIGFEEDGEFFIWELD